MDQAYQYQDLGFTYTVSSLGEIVTDPGFRVNEWFVKHTDEGGIFITPLEMELSYWPGSDPIWDVQVKAVFNNLETIVMIFPAGRVEKEWHITTLLHRSMAHAYTEVADK